MTHATSVSERILPIALAIAGVCMTALSSGLLLNAAKLGLFMHMLLGLIGVNFVNSVILSGVAIRITISEEADATIGEKLVLVGVLICTGVGLTVA